MLIKHKEQHFLRFKNFEEAKNCLEKFDKDSFDAIDYMITHKEFYFLLNTVVKYLPKKEFVEYIFLRLPCLRRKDDIKLLKQINEKYPHVIENYITKCENLRKYFV